MSHRPAKRVRCAIYARVSTEHGLEQDFNSLDAQRDAAEAYVRSQAPEGWTLIRARYDACRSRKAPSMQPWPRRRDTVQFARGSAFESGRGAWPRRHLGPDGEMVTHGPTRACACARARVGSALAEPRRLEARIPGLPRARVCGGTVSNHSVLKLNFPAPIRIARRRY